MKEKVEVPIQIKEKMPLKSPTRTDLRFLDIPEEEKPIIKNNEDPSLHSLGGRLPENFVKQIKKIPPVDSEERKELLPKIKDGDLKARNRMIEGNLGLVLQFAWKFDNNGVDYEDMFQEGVIGLKKAIDGYDPEKGAFSTYAHFWIRQEIVTLMAEQGSGFRRDKNDAYKTWLIDNFRNDYFTEFGRHPTVEEITTKTKIPNEKIEKLINSSFIKNVLSLDQPIESTNGEGEELRLYDLVPNGESVEGIFETKKGILEMLQGFIGKKAGKNKGSIFTQREYDILYLRFGFGDREYTEKEVGEKYNLTTSRIQQIENKALGKIRVINSKEENEFKIEDLL